MRSEGFWGTSPQAPSLEGGDVHVWSVELDRGDGAVTPLLACLAPDERERAARFYFESDRRRFTVARATLRAILGRYLAREPETLAFAYGPHGKPTLAAGCGDGALRFNLSHSHGVALIGITRQRDIGVDVERIRCIPDLEALAERCFAAGETAALRRLTTAQRAEAFFRCWTRKEAYLKALGDGLARPLDAFEVSLLPNEPARLLSVARDPEEVFRWAFWGLAVAPDAIGAVAVSGRGGRVACWRWDG